MARAAPADHIGRRFKLRELYILSAVVQRGSMAKAAAHLAMSQPAVSEAIASLEATLKVRLLDRGPRGIEPTIYAQALLRRGTVVFDELSQGLRDIEYLADPAVGEVRIGCPESLAAGFVPAMIEEFSRRHPQVTFDVVDTAIAALEFRELRERRIDLMLGRIPRDFADDEITVDNLFDDRLLVVASAESRWARRRKIAPAELLDEPWILAPPSNVVRLLFIEAFRARGLEPPGATVTSNSMNVRMHLLASGRFLTFIAESLLRQNARRWSLKALPVDLGVQQLTVGVATLRNRTLSATAQLFIDHLKGAALERAA
ncbi:MAG TPA: LysR family transcriptional regulator [Xanthobacteraceae bacterium]|jgi:DNA-binding transcriptional LysR family regulator|nr:LysR family transcriptional regulator [Xanthobacteraceae bacterium]